MRLAAVHERVTSCAACPRLVEWRERIGREKRKSFRNEEYWARPVPGFGDERARLLLLGLAPAAHGANRTGRMFTGDRSGEWLYAALFRAGFANRPASVSRDDDLRLRDAYITAPVRCAPPANRPRPDEIARCRGFLLDELRLLESLEVILCLGGIAWEQALQALSALGTAVPRPKPRFGHGEVALVGGLTLIGSYHPSQQNTFTGRLTEQMLDDVFSTAKRILYGSGTDPGSYGAQRASGGDTDGEMTGGR